MKEWNKAELLSVLKGNERFFGGTTHDEQIECVKAFIESCYVPSPVPDDYFLMTAENTWATCSCGKSGSGRRFYNWHIVNLRCSKETAGNTSDSENAQSGVEVLL